MRTIALVLALIAITDVTAIQMTAEPVIDSKKEKEPTAEEKDTKLKAKLAENSAKADAIKEKAKEAETKNMNAAEEESDRQKAAYQTAYWANMKTQQDEMAAIAKIRADRPKGEKGEAPAKDSGITDAEHYTMNMPEHVITNKEGATVKYV